MVTTIPETDTEYRDQTIHAVRTSEGGYEVVLDDHWMLWVQEYGREPQPGQTIRMYGRGMVRGIVIDGTVVRYQSDADYRAEQEARAAQRDADRRRQVTRDILTYRAQYEALPEVFRRRIDRFRANNADFWWRFEPYELCCCSDAVKIAAHCGTPDAVTAFHALDYDDQRAAIPDLFEGHSGNSFGMACRLAWLYLTEPDLVWREHGALAPLVGCEEYGCPPVASA